MPRCGVDGRARAVYTRAQMKRLLLALIAPLLCLALAQAAPLKVASLHPLLSEMAANIGGERVKVVDLFPENGSLHAFEPTSRELSMAVGTKLLLACGKGVEPYLEGLRDSLPAKAQVLELGTGIPDVKLPGSERIDPHWWNNPANMKRASRSLADALAKLDPAGEATFRANQKAYGKKMDGLCTVAELLLASIPQEKRVLVTGHAAMCHFCDAFRFTPIAVQGIAAESEGDTASLAKLLAELRAKQVPCLFTEISASPRALDAIAAQVGARTLPLVMDGINPSMRSYDRLFTYNVSTILAGLGGKDRKAPQAPPAPAAAHEHSGCCGH